MNNEPGTATSYNSSCRSITCKTILFPPTPAAHRVDIENLKSYLVFAILNNDRLKVVLDKACVGESTQPDDVFV